MNAGDNSRIQFGCGEGGLYLAVQGGAHDRLCVVAERLLADYLAAHGEPPRVFLDLGGCDWVCSTFAGWMLTLRKKARQGEGQGFVRITACSAGCRDCLDRMHITQLFEQQSAPPPPHLGRMECSNSPQCDEKTIELMRRAHEELAAIDAENQRVFGPIANMLRQQLEKFRRPMS